MNLKDSHVKAAKYEGKPQKLRDGNGLYLHVLPSGKYWRYDYRYTDKRKTLSIGVYPKISLKQARLDLGDAKSLIAKGVDPSYQKKITKQIPKDQTFGGIAEQWLERQKSEWKPGHHRTVKVRLEKDLIPLLGDRPIDKIEPPEILAACRRAESRGAIETAHRLRSICSQVFCYSVSLGIAKSDPTRDLRGALKTPKEKQFAALTEPKDFGQLMRAINGYSGAEHIRCALQLIAHSVVRPGELRLATWDQINIKKCTWTIDASRMKGGREHRVPLSKQSVEILKELQAITGGSDLLFPSLRSKGKPISDNTLNSALRSVGYDGSKHVAHGFRHSFSTICNESDKFNDDHIEAALAHKTPGMRGTYNKATYWDHRVVLMQAWSDAVDRMEAKKGAFND